MINPVSSHSPIYSAATPAPPAQQPAVSPKDTVQLSQAAKAASGDVDHDGDSH